MAAIKVTAKLGSPLATRSGEHPQLDSLLTWQVAKLRGLIGRCDRRLPIPEMPPIPLAQGKIGGSEVYRSSEPILPEHTESVERFSKQFPAHDAAHLVSGGQQVIYTGQGEFKSYHLPIRTLRIGRVVWFAEGNRKEVRRLLKKIRSLGYKRSQGYGVVTGWQVDPAEADYSWFAPHERGQVLMRRLPLCDDLPADLFGLRRDFGACQSPYWHPDRYQEIVVPC